MRLLDGPFLDAQRRDSTYLLSLQPDRMLHNFRANAGLEPKAPVYGGWESEEPWVGIRCHGHTLSHYLSAASLMYGSTGDDRMKQRVDYIVAELHACQTAARSGLVCAFPDGAAQLENAVAGRRFESTLSASLRLGRALLATRMRSHLAAPEQRPTGHPFDRITASGCWVD